MNDIMTSTLALDMLCLDIIEAATEYFEKSPPKSGNKSPRERVEFWVENYLTPAIENAIDDTFGD